MSKFVRDLNIKDVGNRNENNTYQNNSGGYNVVDNSTTNNHSVTNKHVHHNSGPEQGNDAAVILIPIFFGLVFIIWLFFNNFDLVTKVVNIGSYTSPLLAVVSVIILFANNQFETTDLRNLICSIALGLLVLLLNENAYYTAPLDVVDLSKQYSSIIDFWNGLSEDQHNRAVITFCSYALIFVSGLLNHLISFRQLCYSLADKHKIGFWYLLFAKTDSFRFRYSGVIIILFSVFAYLILKGYLFHA